MVPQFVVLCMLLLDRLEYFLLLFFKHFPSPVINHAPDPLPGCLFKRVNQARRAPRICPFLPSKLS